MTDPGARATFQIHPVGYVRRRGKRVFLEIRDCYRPALKELDQFSHVLVIWWADKHDDARSRGRLQTEPPYAKGHLTGVFACRAEYRPNPIAVTTCQMLATFEARGEVEVRNIDAYDGTPILDLKAYFPVCERVKDARIPPWLSDWPAWFPEEGLGLER
jgi:tRNA-Thr(GGU) m(6)t(6)A37 methyltransferase TsaA